jgi:uroporphyrinogen decarboxylase
MNPRELVRTIIARGRVPRCGFWLGNPKPETWPILHAYFGTSDEEELRRKLGDDFRWICPQYMDTTYRHPAGKGIFDIWKYKKSLGEAGPFAECEDPAQVGRYDWPDPRLLDFRECIAALESAGPYYRASGFWCPFFHDVMDLFGVENFIFKMYTHPGVVHAAFDRVCGFYYEANERFYREAGTLVDGFFFGNDFGTQLDLLITPDQFDEFILPHIRRFTRQARDAGYQVILHSCGSVFRLIDRFIEAGVDCLHPLQAKAGRMDAVTLSERYRGRITFLGGIDTQDLLIHGAPADVKAEVRRVKDLLGPHFIVSPSHEALLPDISPENVAAMAEAAAEDI